MVRAASLFYPPAADCIKVEETVLLLKSPLVELMVIGFGGISASVALSWTVSAGEIGGLVASTSSPSMTFVATGFGLIGVSFASAPSAYCYETLLFFVGG